MIPPTNSLLGRISGHGWIYRNMTLKDNSIEKPDQLFYNSDRRRQFAKRRLDDDSREC